MDRIRSLLFDALRHPRACRRGEITESRAMLDDEAQRASLEALIKKCTRLPALDLSKIGIAGADVANNVIDYYESRFAESALRQMRALIPTSGMSVGHDMAGWSYATTFWGGMRGPDQERSERKLRELRDISLATWLMSRYYWPLETSWGRDLQARVDYGIAREVSAHWMFDLAVCSLCEDDLRKCDHWPGDTYDVNGSDQKCWYEMRDVTDYIETGFVVKGGQRGTSIYQVGRGADVGFDEALREVKSSARLWGAWCDATKDARSDATKRRVVDGSESGLRFFARALAADRSRAA